MPSTGSGFPAASRIAENVEVEQAVLVNFQALGDELRERCKRAGGSGATCSTYRISLINRGKGPAIAPGVGDWTLYFHSVRRALAVLNRDDLVLEHVKGDLHRLRPTSAFSGLGEGELLEIDLLAEHWLQAESDLMPRMFVVDGDGRARVIASTDSDAVDGLVAPINSHHPDNWKRTAGDASTLATAATRYAEFSAVAHGAAGDWRHRMIPQAQKTRVTGSPLAIDAGIVVDATALAPGTITAVQARVRQLGLGATGEAAYPVTVAIVPGDFDDGRSGAYRLDIRSDGAEIVGFDAAGAFYGVQSLLALADPAKATLPRVVVEDGPRFPHRGMFLDVGRNFHSKELVLKLLDQMAAYKLNRFHFHLSDDEGWRLEIPGLPELTDVGARRCFDLAETRCLLPQLGSGPDTDNSGSGHFTVGDYIDIVRFAAARHIEVIPEFDMPAHARAAVVAMEARYRKLVDESPGRAGQYRLIDPEDDTRYLSVQFYDDSYINPCIESTYAFVGKVMREVQAMHREAGQPLRSWHFGGDEAVNILASDAFEAAPGTDPDRGDVPAAARRQPWSGSPQCEKLVAGGAVDGIDDLGAYYASRVSQLVADAGIETLAAWNDGVKSVADAEASLATEDNYANAWAPLFWGGGDESVHLAEAGFDVVQAHSDFLYFDMPYELDPEESGYYWASRGTDTRKTFSYAPLNTAQLAEISLNRDGQPWSARAPAASFAERVRGVQGQLWSEVVRTDARVEYMVFPRLLALAERAWHRAPWELPLEAGQEFSAETSRVDRRALAEDWRGFAAVLGQRELPKLDRAGVGYRIPVPGAIARNGRLHTAMPFPGLPLEYFDGEQWQSLATGASTAAGGVKAVRALSADGRREGRAVSLPAIASGDASPAVAGD
ncbi:family 20 glycosylhydrolase [Microbulbifer sediminum]|uniref:family 20 glycosylhydrolase n=1 Tax=Microbulbifer sediminum TaxID=2904250 RepID=UPI001F2F06C3|nr:family 20 glycosylhydrolase [Microbulbifer sediminum]